MAKQKIPAFFFVIVLILAANIPFSAASFPTLLTRRQNYIPTKLIGWTQSPSPESYSDNGIKGGYWPSWLAYSFPPPSIPTLYFTHVLYSFVAIDASTYNLSLTQSDDEWMGNFTATLHAQKPPAKALLSIGGNSGYDSTFSTMVSDPDNRSVFIKSAISTARNYGFDGIDLDWEFPNTQQDMSNLALLFQEWRQAIESEGSDSGKSPLLLTAAVYFASTITLDQQPRTYPGDAIAKYVDFVNPMCFNYRGIWDTTETGEHALLFDKSSNISTSSGILSWIQVGVPPGKLVMGMPLFGKTWKLKDPDVNGIGAPAVGVGPGNNGTMLYYEIVDYNAKNNAHEEYENDTVSEYSYSGTDWIGYDGPQSVPAKIKWAKEQKLGGYFFWAIGYDDNSTLSEIASNAWALGWG